LAEEVTAVYSVELVACTVSKDDLVDRYGSAGWWKLFVF